MKLLSVNVSQPKAIAYSGKLVTTGIFKEPVPGRVMVRRLNLEGDGQADLTVHGGVDKAVYVYDLDSYRYWRQELGRADLAYGHFGENLTVEGLLDDHVHIGDIFRIGEALLEVTPAPRPLLQAGDKDGDAGILSAVSGLPSSEEYKGSSLTNGDSRLHSSHAT